MNPEKEYLDRNMNQMLENMDIKTNAPTRKLFKMVGREKSGIGGGSGYSITPVCLCKTCRTIIKSK